MLCITFVMMLYLNSKHGRVMQKAALRKMSYMKVTQKHLYSTVVSSLDMLKQSYSGVKRIRQSVHHMNARSHNLCGIVVANGLGR